MEISPDAKAAGVALKDLSLDPGIRIGYVERRGELIVPRADTVLRAGDKATVIGTPETLRTARYFRAFPPIRAG